MAKKTKEEITGEAVTLYNEVKDIEVVDQPSYENAGAALIRIKEGRKAVKAVFRPILDRINENKKQTMGEYKKFDSPLEAAESALKDNIAQYIDAQRKEQLRLEEELRAKAQKEEETKQLAAAEKLEASGDQEQAEAAIEEPVVVQPAPVRIAPKAKGVSTKQVWKAEVTDLMALVKAVADGKAPIVMLQPDTKKIGELVRTLQGGFDYPGVRAYPETVVSGRTA